MVLIKLPLIISDVLSVADSKPDTTNDFLHKTANLTQQYRVNKKLIKSSFVISD